MSRVRIKDILHRWVKWTLICWAIWWCASVKAVKFSILCSFIVQLNISSMECLINSLRKVQYDIFYSVLVGQELCHLIWVCFLFYFSLGVGQCLWEVFSVEQRVFICTDFPKDTSLKKCRWELSIKHCRHDKQNSGKISSQRLSAVLCAVSACEVMGRVECDRSWIRPRSLPVVPDPCTVSLRVK